MSLHLTQLVAFTKKKLKLKTAAHIWKVFVGILLSQDKNPLSLGKMKVVLVERNLEKASSAPRQARSQRVWSSPEAPIQVASLFWVSPSRAVAPVTTHGRGLGEVGQRGLQPNNSASRKSSHSDPPESELLNSFAGLSLLEQFCGCRFGKMSTTFC